MNVGVLFQFLDAEQNTEVAGPILEDLQRVNDLGFYTPFLLYAYDRAGILWSQDEPGVAGPMQLFLLDRAAFEFGDALSLAGITTLRLVSSLHSVWLFAREGVASSNLVSRSSEHKRRTEQSVLLSVVSWRPLTISLSVANRIICSWVNGSLSSMVTAEAPPGSVPAAAD